MSEKVIKPDYIFETSWEICNKVGGIYTVLSTKARTITEDYGDNYILIGPDVWMETSEHPDFIEDFDILTEWREKAAQEGLNIRLGRWNVSGYPLVILVDFKPLFTEKDKIFYELWEQFKLDSLSGQWDYIEPAMFGYAAARVIESYYEFHLSSKDRIVAHFHEWMTGTGILYLKTHVAQVATVFTSHATVLGRSIAGNGLPLYGDMEKYKAEETARSFGVLSKQSLESMSAKQADSFTTVSEITARECKHFLRKTPDVITVNGFEDSFVPPDDKFDEKRQEARQKLLSVASAVTGQKMPDDSLLVINSGRYEFHNKGMDIFIDALAELNKMDDLPKKVIAYITVPANHAGARQDVLKRMNDLHSEPVEKPWLSHYLFDEEKDPSIRRIKEKGLMNNENSKVSVIFVPAYLDGRDGIFNMPYYDILIGFDVSVFPSYYEPWGYTPLESIAFSIPTVTTSLAGFGSWVNDFHKVEKKGVIVSERTDDNEADVVKDIFGTLKAFAEMSAAKYDEAAREAYKISRDALWQSFIDNYRKAWSVALHKVGGREELFSGKQQQFRLREYIPATDIDAEPKWKKILVKAKIPQKLIGLQELSKNLWWSWNCEAEAIFKYMHREKWDASGHNPVAFLEAIPMDRYKELEKDKEFLKMLESVMNQFTKYIEKKPAAGSPLISYFSMEYGLHTSIKIYSGGLGILAGDYLKQASDSNLNMIGIGLMYRYGYFNQRLSPHGEQIAEYVRQRFSYLPISPVRDEQGKWIKINLALPGRSLTAKAWQLDIGRIKLYLLDTDISDNQDKDRTITHHLYGGNNEHRLKQELLLGVGGIRLLEALKLSPNVYHCNEGHAAFIGIERMRRLIESRIITYPMAKEIVRASTLFTTHTPVPAGHDAFSEDLLRTYIPHYPGRLNISWDEFMQLGRANPHSKADPFSMSVLAVNLSGEVNGVSRIHGKESRKMFSVMYPGYFPEEVNIGHITNGVHYATWTSRIWIDLFKETFGPGFYENQSDPKYWEKVRDIPDNVIWNVRQELKSELFAFLKKRLTEDMAHRQEAPQIIINTIDKLDANILTIGFARRFATYKRAQLLFKNEAQLARIVNNPDRPVQFIFAGKAHPNDKAGQDLIRHIIETSRKPEFQGRIVFLENYDMQLARKLVQGVDVWLNTPTRPLEASGTSGMKALMNGVLNFSVMDGWWAEGFRENAGWAIEEKRTFDNQQFQDELDAETIYNIFEDDIIPRFYKLNQDNVPAEWIRYVKNSIAGICSEFTMKRMLDQYVEKYYNSIAERAVAIKANNCALAAEIADWKSRIRAHWPEIVVKSVKVPDAKTRALTFGESFKVEVQLDCGQLSPEDIELEVVFGQQANLGLEDVLFVKKLRHRSTNKEGLSVFAGDFEIDHAGSLDYAIRIFPSNPLLPNKQETGLLRYI
ncbi:MAG: alpha-glucan family phosphorylase [Bacteroidales bacterium]|nr:alpha-glucan family phosphorylase [Bacteroidales bacterium]